MLTTDQIDTYTEEGYLVIEDALTAQQLTELQTVTDNFIERSRQVAQSNDIYDLDSNHTAHNPRLNRIKAPHIQHGAYWDVLTSESVLSRIRPLLGPNIRLNNSKLNTKAGNGGAAVQWHQDWGFYPHTNDDLLAVGIMLSDISEQDGPLMVVPGSHKGPVLPHTTDGVFCGAVDPQHPDANLDKAVTLTGPAGSMSIHHVRALHGSAPNFSSNPRLLLLFECCAADAWPINGNQSVYAGLSQQQFWAEMESRMICGEQSLQPRLADVPVRMPLPPPPDTTSIFKVQQSGRAIDGFAQRG